MKPLTQEALAMASGQVDFSSSALQQMDMKTFVDMKCSGN